MKQKRRLISLFSLFFVFFSLSTKGSTNELKAVSFYQDETKSTVEFVFDQENVEITKDVKEREKQLLVDIKNTTAASKILRSFDTSQFEGNVLFVSAYKIPQTENIRVALQLRALTPSNFERQGAKILLHLQHHNEKENQLAGTNTSKEIDLTSLSSEEKTLDKTAEINSSVEEVLEVLVKSGPKKYKGKKITINVKEMPVSSLLQMIAEASGFNVILGQEIFSLPPLGLTLIEVPWDQALDTILSTSNLVAKKNGIILTITTLEKANKEKELEILARKMRQNSDPLVTKIFPVSFATGEDIKKILDPYSTPERGTVTIDSRTNYIIVKDSPEVIEKMKKVVEALDTQTPQVLIEAKIVEVSEKYSKEIGFRSGIGASYNPFDRGPSVASAAPKFSFNSVSGLPKDVAPNSAMALQFTNIGRFTDIALDLQLMESESKARIVSNPKVITQNKKKATLKVNTSYAFEMSKMTSAGTLVPGLESINAGINFNVTPQVTNEGSVVLDIDLTKDDFETADSSISKIPPTKGRSMKTSVLVDNGSTLVIGGLYNFLTGESHS